MKKETLGVALPLFKKNASVAAVLDDPAVEACGAIVSTDGSKGYWLHSLKDLRAERRRHGASIKIADLKSGKQALLTATIRGEIGTGLNLRVPAATDMMLARTKFKTAVGIEPTAQAQATAKMKTALVFARKNTSFVIVGKAYVCDKFREPYDQADYDAYDGKCPLHKNGRLIAP